MAGSKRVKLSTFSGFLIAKFAKYSAQNERPTKRAFDIQSFLQFQQSKENYHHFLKEHFVQIFKYLTKYQLKKQYDFL